MTGVEAQTRSSRILEMRAATASIEIGLKAIELMADPLFGTAIACSKLGWREFRTAIWGRRRDLLDDPFLPRVLGNAGTRNRRHRGH